jgi:hypothetical protein
MLYRYLCLDKTASLGRLDGLTAVTDDSDNLSIGRLYARSELRMIASHPQRNVSTFASKDRIQTNRASHVLYSPIKSDHDNFNPVSNSFLPADPSFLLTHLLHALDRLAKRCRVHTLTKREMQEQG